MQAAVTLTDDDRSVMREEAVRVVELILLADSLYSKAVRVWDIMLRLWVIGEEFEVSLLMLKDLERLTDTPFWGGYRADIKAMLEGYDAFKQGSGQVGGTCLKKLNETVTGVSGLVEKIMMVELALASLQEGKQVQQEKKVPKVPDRRKSPRRQV